jgi:hypothetical protein
VVGETIVDLLIVVGMVGIVQCHVMVGDMASDWSESEFLDVRRRIWRWLRLNGILMLFACHGGGN